MDLNKLYTTNSHFKSFGHVMTENQRDRRVQSKKGSNLNIFPSRVEVGANGSVAGTIHQRSLAICNITPQFVPWNGPSA